MYMYATIRTLHHNCRGCPISLFIQLGNSALMVAAMNGRTEVVIQLVEAGANLNLQNMVHLSSLQCTKYTHCCNSLTVCVISQKGDSVVIIATAKRRSGALRRLVTAGADLNLQNEVRELLHVYICIQCLLDHCILGGSDGSDDLSKNWKY